MNENNLEIKLSFVPGLQSVVMKEIEQHSDFSITEEVEDAIYVNFFDNFDLIKKLRSVARAYVVTCDPEYNPFYISNHKSILGDLIDLVIDKNDLSVFKTFKITCAGSDSKEIKEIEAYIEHEFRLIKKEEADLKIHIVKLNDIWEVGAQITPRPLSLREYKVKNMSGAIDPTIAYAMNSFCDLEKAASYLNIFSGSATLMIEAGQCYLNLEKIIGFDNNKEHLSLSIQNIKEAGLIKKVQVKEFDIFRNPDLGSFDAITSDLPFGMAISKNADLEKLYKNFIEYAQAHLNSGGVLAVYTSEFKVFEKIISDYKFEVIKDLDIPLITSEEKYLPTKILVFKLR